MKQSWRTTLWNNISTMQWKRSSPPSGDSNRTPASNCLPPLKNNTYWNWFGLRRGLGHAKRFSRNHIFDQRYKFIGESRLHIFLYGSSTGSNSLSKLSHQIDAEISGMQLSVKETSKCLETLPDFNISVKPRLISDSPTCLSLWAKSSVQLDIGTALVQEVLGYSHLFFAPGNLFADNVDLLTRYRLRLLSLITDQFYAPDFLNPEVNDRLTVRAHPYDHCK